MFVSSEISFSVGNSISGLSLIYDTGRYRLDLQNNSIRYELGAKIDYLMGISDECAELQINNSNLVIEGEESAKSVFGLGEQIGTLNLINSRFSFNLKAVVSFTGLAGFLGGNSALERIVLEGKVVAQEAAFGLFGSAGEASLANSRLGMVLEVPEGTFEVALLAK